MIIQLLFYNSLVSFLMFYSKYYSNENLMKFHISKYDCKRT